MSITIWLYLHLNHLIFFGYRRIVNFTYFFQFSVGAPVSKRNSRGKKDFFLSNSNSNSNNEIKRKSVVKLLKGDENYTKLYDSINKKSSCELNGKKSTIKNMVNNLKNDIRFWSSESLLMLENGSEGCVNYIDKNLCDNGNILLEKIDHVFTKWVLAYEKIQDLKL